jgi:4-amino-4-deoxy-L-arabinose transferase-like glycosyltransferase
MILNYLYQYVKFGRFTAYFLIVVLVVILVKYAFQVKWKIPVKPAMLAIIMLGFILRLIWLGYSSHTPISSWNPDHMLENDLIHIHAIELTHGIWFHDQDGMPSGRRPIGYPMALAMCYKIFGPNTETAWALNLVLYLVTIMVLFKISQSIFGNNTALLASFLFAVYPLSIYSIKLITDEHLFLPLWYSGLLLLIIILQGRKVKADWFWLGLIFGYATMIRTHTIFMPLVVGLSCWLFKGSLKNAIVKCVLVAVTMQLVNLPWVIRNYKVWGVPVLYTATGGFVYSQVNPTAGPEGGGHIPKIGEPGYSDEFHSIVKSGNEGRIHQAANREIAKWIVNYPRQFIVMGTSRLLDFMHFNRKGGVWAMWYQYYPGSFDPSRPIPQKLRNCLEEYAFVFYYIIFFSWLFGCIALCINWKRLSTSSIPGLIVLGMCFLFYFLEHMIIYPDRKYRFPLEPLMFIAASYFFCRLNANWYKKFRRH